MREDYSVSFRLFDEHWVGLGHRCIELGKVGGGFVKGVCEWVSSWALCVQNMDAIEIMMEKNGK